MIPRTGSGTGHRRELWPVLVLLVLTVALPTACVLWFMSRAMSNERLAVRQRLDEANRAQLLALRTRLQSLWLERLDALAGMDPDRPGAELFAEIVRDRLADSAVLYGPAGEPAYPENARPPVEDAERPPVGWSRAEDLEYRRNDPDEAARLYERIARQSVSPHVAGRALLARARCLAKADRADEAIDLLVGELGGEKYRDARDAQGRLLQPDGLLRALELMSGPEHPAHDRTVRRLAERLDRYDAGPFPARQRLFLMKRLRELVTPPPEFETLESEEIAAAYLEQNPTLSEAAYVSPFELPEAWLSDPGDMETPSLRPSLLPRIWQLALPRGRGVLLFTHDRVVAEVEELFREQAVDAGAAVVILPSGAEPDPATAFPSLSAGRPLVGWRLGLRLGDPGSFDSSVSRRSTVYLWTGILFITAITALAALIAGFVGRQVRVARLKNDLVATVTHELKTPLSSMRMLVDTLLEGHHSLDERKTREYLELISRENSRLSRLIDHFLTFSRMERNKNSFEFQAVAPQRIVKEAVEAIRERLEAAGFELTAEVSPDLPEIAADPDAMVTVLLNLLENAYKYSDEDRRVAVRAVERDGTVCLEVEDHGIGMTARTARKVFDRFFQADRSLARRAGGCGLGLSIVKFVVDAHGGEVRVDSRPGAGSRFTILLPRGDSPEALRLLEGAR